MKEHPFFEREGNDLHCVIPISFAQAALGTEIQVPTLEGEQTLKVPEERNPVRPCGSGAKVCPC